MMFKLIIQIVKITSKTYIFFRTIVVQKKKVESKNEIIIYQVFVCFINIRLKYTVNCKVQNKLHL